MLLLLILILPSILSNVITKRDFEDVAPVQHIKEVKDGYIAKPDAQLGDEKIEETVVTKNCRPKEESSPRDPPPKFQGGINAEYDDVAGNEEVAKSFKLEKEARVFNDTTNYNVTEVIERVELKIIKPLCDD